MQILDQHHFLQKKVYIYHAWLFFRLDQRSTIKIQVFIVYIYESSAPLYKPLLVQIRNDKVCINIKRILGTNFDFSNLSSKKTMSKWLSVKLNKYAPFVSIYNSKYFPSSVNLNSWDSWQVDSRWLVYVNF